LVSGHVQVILTSPLLLNGTLTTIAHGGVAHWLQRWSLAGGLPLIYA